MLNPESKDYKSYVGKTFDDWDEFIDANGEVIMDRDLLKHKLKQDFVIYEYPNGKVDVKAIKGDFGTSAQPTGSGSMAEKREIQDKIRYLYEELNKNKEWRSIQDKIEALPFPKITPRPLEERNIEDMRQGYRLAYNEYLRYCKRINVEELILANIDNPDFDIKDYEGKYMMVHTYKPQERKKPKIDKYRF